MRVRLLALLLAASGAAFAGDKEFDYVVQAIESHYGTTRTHIPFMGVADFFVKVARPAGTSGFKLAVFENIESSPGYREQAELDQFMRNLSGSGLHPLVRAHSRRDGESTYIYMGEAGRSTKMLIATFQRNESTVIEVHLNMNTLLKTLEAPELAGKFFAARQDR